MFFAILILPFLGGPAKGVEIYANGHRYASMQEYQDMKNAAAISTVPALSRKDENFILKEGQKLGIKVDLSKVKTIQLKPKLSDVALHNLYILGVERGVVDALRNFYQKMSPSDIRVTPRILSNQLQDVIKQEVTTSKNPKLLISQHGKMRIMSLTPDNSQKV
jgi:hypothetical protein